RPFFGCVGLSGPGPPAGLGGPPPGVRVRPPALGIFGPVLLSPPPAGQEGRSPAKSAHLFVASFAGGFKVDCAFGRWGALGGRARVAVLSAARPVACLGQGPPVRIDRWLCGSFGSFLADSRGRRRQLHSARTGARLSFPSQTVSL
ncbi:unnamed protein product, partial [Amoebophrya sp. A120]